jgi:Rrf2 family protein
MLLRQDRALLALDIALDIAFHAGRGGDVTGAAEVAARLGLLRRGIEPLLQGLVRAGFLESLRGPHGGYRLARSPRDIRLDELLAVSVDEDRAPSPAGRLAAAVTAPLWIELDQLVTGHLRSLTLDDLLKRAGAAGLRRPASAPLHFSI